jgi:hypothetical protein
VDPILTKTIERRFKNMLTRLSNSMNLIEMR